MPRQSSPYKQVLNKDKEPVFYEIKEFILYLNPRFDILRW